MPYLVKPRNEDLVHPAADLLEVYDTESFPSTFRLDWSTDRI